MSQLTNHTAVRLRHRPVSLEERPYVTYHSICDLNAFQLWAICNQENIEVYNVYTKQLLAQYTPEHYQYPKQKGEEYGYRDREIDSSIDQRCANA